MPCDPAVLSSLHLFEHLQEEDGQRVAGVMDEIELPASPVLFRTGEPGDSLFIVRSGEVELYIKDTAGQKIVLTIAREGEMFGELALLDSGARTATAIALADSQLLVLDRDDLLLLFQRTPAAALRLLAAMSHMTRRADELLRTRFSRNFNEEVEERLTPLQRVPDWIAWFSGTTSFLFLNS